MGAQAASQSYLSGADSLGIVVFAAVEAKKELVVYSP